jgi:hypothetical protein
VYQNEYITPAMTITQTVAATGYVTANYITNTLEQNLPFRLAANFGGLTAGTLYYVDNIVSQTAVWNIANDQTLHPFLPLFFGIALRLNLIATSYCRSNSVPTVHKIQRPTLINMQYAINTHTQTHTYIHTQLI